MSVAIDNIETMFDHGEMHSAAALDDTYGYEFDSDVREPDALDSDVLDSDDDRSAAEIRAAVADAATATAGSPNRGARRSSVQGTGTQGASVQELQARIRHMQGTRLDTRSLPTHPAIASLLPGGALQQGGAYSVERSATLIMALLAGPSAAGSWCGIVGVPEFGVEAAAGYGIDLERLVLVPYPGDQWLQVTAAIADVMTVVVTRPPKQASDGQVARLAARLRQRGATLIVLGAWPQTEAMLSITDSSWSGIGHGHGHLTAREVTVTVSTRTSGRPRSARLWLPDREVHFSAVGSPVVEIGREPRAAEYRAVEPRTAEARTAGTRAVETRAVEPRAVETRAVESHTAEPRAVEPRAVKRQEAMAG